MAKIPTNDSIDYILNHEKQRELPRDYLGLSQIGHNCHRYLQYSHYWAYKSEITSRIRRLFDFGHMMEDKMIEDLAAVEIFVTDRESEMVGTAGHWKGHADGIAISAADIDQRFLVEFKTHNDKSFGLLIKEGLRKSKPMHYDQMTAYMGYLDLPFCLYLAYNKNTSEYWYKIIQFDKERFKELKQKEMEVIVSDTLLPRIGNNSASWFECKFCDAKKVCFKDEKPPINCRNCANVDVLDKGKWRCAVGCGRKMASVLLTADMQRNEHKSCGEYKLGDMFK